MLILEYKLRTNKVQEAAIDEAIRTTQFIRNKCLRKWMDGRGIGDNDLQVYCSKLAREYPFAARLNSMARQSGADRAWLSIARFYKNCRQKKPGKKGYPRFQKATRSVEYKTSGWKLEPDGKRITVRDGMGLGTVRLIGKKGFIEPFPLKPIKRVRLVKRADGSYVQFAVQADRHIEHVPTGKQVGIDVGLKAYYTDSDGQTVTNPRYLRRAEKKLKRLHRRVSRRQKRSQNRKKAIKRLAKGHLKVSRQRKDYAAKAASALVKSSDFIAYEDLQIADLVRNHHLAKSISDASWGLYLTWVRHYGEAHNIPILAVPPGFTTQDCVSLWLSRQEEPQRAHPYLSQLWAGVGPGLERGPEHSSGSPRGCRSPYRRAGGNGFRLRPRLLAGVRRKATLLDRPPPRLCSQGHVASGLGEGRSPRLKGGGVSIARFFFVKGSIAEEHGSAMNVLLVTVNYLDHRVDLGLPADLPVGSFLPMLLEICGLVPSGTSDSDEEWELAPFGGDVLPIAASLESCGVLDGARLVLRVAASTEIEVSERQSGRAYMPAYPSINADAGVPIVNWIRDDLFTE